MELGGREEPCGYEYVSAITVRGESPTEEQLDGRALIIHASVQADRLMRIPVNESSRLGQPFTAHSFVSDGAVSCVSPYGSEPWRARRE